MGRGEDWSRLGIIQTAREYNTGGVAHRQKTFFSPAIEYAIPSPSLPPFTHLSLSFTIPWLPTIAYLFFCSSFSFYNMLRSAMTRRSLRFARRGNNKDRGHVYHTLLDTGLLQPRTSLGAASPFKDARFGHGYGSWDIRDVLKRKGKNEESRGSDIQLSGYCFPGNRVWTFLSKWRLILFRNHNLFYLLHARVNSRDWKIICWNGLKDESYTNV